MELKTEAGTWASAGSTCSNLVWTAFIIVVESPPRMASQIFHSAACSGRATSRTSTNRLDSKSGSCGMACPSQLSSVQPSVGLPSIWTTPVLGSNTVESPLGTVWASMMRLMKKGRSGFFTLSSAHTKIDASLLNATSVIWPSALTTGLTTAASYIESMASVNLASNTTPLTSEEPGACSNANPNGDPSDQAPAVRKAS